MSDTKYGKYIIDRAKEGFGPPETPEEARRREEHVTFPLYVDEEMVPGAYYFMAAWWKKITGEGSPAEEHDHDFDEYLVFLVSSLDKLILGLKPYWGTGTGPLHMTAVAARPKKFLKAIAGFFRGNLNRHVTAENGYHSHEIETIRLGLRGGFTLDGELYQTGAPDYAIDITCGGHAQFVCQNG